MAELGTEVLSAAYMSSLQGLTFSHSTHTNNMKDRACIFCPKPASPAEMLASGNTSIDSRVQKSSCKFLQRLHDHTRVPSQGP